jgi:hypothetical protein
MAEVLNEALNVVETLMVIPKADYVLGDCVVLNESRNYWYVLGPTTRAANPCLRDPGGRRYTVTMVIKSAKGDDGSMVATGLNFPSVCSVDESQVAGQLVYVTSEAPSDFSEMV